MQQGRLYTSTPGSKEKIIKEILVSGEGVEMGVRGVHDCTAPWSLQAFDVLARRILSFVASAQPMTKNTKDTAVHR